MDLALVFFAWLWSLAGKGDGSSAPSSPSYPSSPSPPQLPPGTTTSAPPPWPQVVPSGLPPFPGSGWVYDEPPPAAVQQRAGQLVNSLWAQGSGAYKIEQTAGRWIAYRAEIVASGKKGVVAYRQKSAAAPARTPAAMATRPSSSPTPKTTPAPSSSPTPKTVPVRVVIPPRAPTPEQAAAQSAASQQYSLPLASELPDLKEGMGTKASPNKHVALAQQRLQFHGFQLVADGVFGNATRMAVIELQKRAALAPRDQTNAQLKARGFGAVKRATWEVLLQTRPLLSSAPLVRA